MLVIGLSYMYNGVLAGLGWILFLVIGMKNVEVFWLFFVRIFFWV